MQTSLFAEPTPKKKRGGKRENAGRKRVHAKKTLPHKKREDFVDTTPIHVTVKLRAHVRNLRSKSGFAVAREALERAKRTGFAQIVGYGVEGNHLHLAVEARGRKELGKLMQRFGSLLAKGINAWMGTKGPVLEDRYHARVLRTATEVRNVLRYIANNATKHALQAGRTVIGVLRDECCSLGEWFRGITWAGPAVGPPLGTEPWSRLLRQEWMYVGPW